jgi:hypothetical protein
MLFLFKLASPFFSHGLDFDLLMSAFFYLGDWRVPFGLRVTFKNFIACCDLIKKL